MPHPFDSPGLRAAFLDALRERPCLRDAARAVGVSPNAAKWARDRDAEFAAAVAALLPRRTRNLPAANAIHEPGVRAAFLAAYAATPNIWHAAAAAGVSRGAVDRLRHADPDFAAEIDALRRGPLRRLPRPFGATAQAAFLRALADHGNVGRAAAAARAKREQVYALRYTDTDFAAAWARARQQAREALEDKLFDGAINGFVTETTTAAGQTVRRRTRAPMLMLRLLERRDKLDPLRPNNWVELTPELGMQAKRRIYGQIRIAAQQGAAEALADRDGVTLQFGRMRPAGAWEAALRRDGEWASGFIATAPETPAQLAEAEAPPIMLAPVAA